MSAHGVLERNDEGVVRGAEGEQEYRFTPKKLNNLLHQAYTHDSVASCLRWMQHLGVEDCILWLGQPLQVPSILWVSDASRDAFGQQIGLQFIQKGKCCLSFAMGV